MGIGAFVGIVMVMTLGPILPVSALTLSSPRDCTTNDVINCGALSTAELQNSYKIMNDKKKGVKELYRDHFGISEKDISNIGKTAKAGRVYKNGEVWVGDKKVATGAVTAGRGYIDGSTKVTAGGNTFYIREPRVSFRASSIAAFVVMEDGVFKYAILASCGNPVKATPVDNPKPTPPPKDDTPIVTTSVRTSTQLPDGPAVLPVSTSTKALPETGPGDIGFVVCLAIVGGYLYHVGHRRIRRRRALRAGL